MLVRPLQVVLRSTVHALVTLNIQRPAARAERSSYWHLDLGPEEMIKEDAEVTLHASSPAVVVEPVVARVRPPREVPPRVRR